MARMIEHTRAMIRGEAPPPPVAKLIGFDVVLVEPGKSVIEFQVMEAHRNPMGTLHGGILCDIADAAMGIAYGSNLEDGESFTTLELKINFLKPVWNAHLRAIGRQRRQHRPSGSLHIASDSVGAARRESVAAPWRADYATAGRQEALSGCVPIMPSRGNENTRTSGGLEAIAALRLRLKPG